MHFRADHRGHAGCALRVADEFPVVAGVVQIERGLAERFAVAQDFVVGLETGERRRSRRGVSGNRERDERRGDDTFDHGENSKLTIARRLARAS